MNGEDSHLVRQLCKGRVLLRGKRPKNEIKYSVVMEGKRQLEIRQIRFSGLVKRQGSKVEEGVDQKEDFERGSDVDAQIFAYLF